MFRPTDKVGQKPFLWSLLTVPIRKCFKLRYLLMILILLILWTYLRLINNAPVDQPAFIKRKSTIHEPIKPMNNIHFNNCSLDENDYLFHSVNTTADQDSRIHPTIERLNKLFQILISHEQRYQKIFEYLNIFLFTDISNTLRPYTNDIENFEKIYCNFQHFLPKTDDGKINVTQNFLLYLKQISKYLSDGFNNPHSAWYELSENKIDKPVIVLAANAQFYATLQASMRTVDRYLKNYSIAIYDLGFHADQLTMIKENCDRCTIIPFPFKEIESAASHVRTLGNFAWKPIIIQDAIRRFGTIIYGDTSVRYQTSNFNKLLIDNTIRGFSCRELPGHYLPCFTVNGTFSWFQEMSSTFEDIYIAEAGFVAVTDNFLSRLILKTWVTCALDSNCIAPTNTVTYCKRRAVSVNVHRYDQSAMVIVLSFFFYPSLRQNDKTNPAPYDMFVSMQTKLAEVRRFEGDHNYFTRKSNRSKR